MRMPEEKMDSMRDVPRRLILAAMMMFVFVFTACGKAETENPISSEETSQEELTDGTDLLVEKADVEWDKIPAVMVDGRLYYDTGRESAVDARCGMMDGEITSSVDGSEWPARDGESNFGTGYGYQYGENDTIEIYINDKWMVFEQRPAGSIRR